MKQPPAVAPRRFERAEGRAALQLASLPVLVLLTAPLAALAWYTLPRAPWSRLAGPALLDALRLSLETSSLVTLLCALTGTPLAYLLARFEFRRRDWIDTLVDLPLTIPPVVAGVALLLTFGRMGLLGRYFEAAGVRIAFSTTAVVLAQWFMAVPLFIRVARAGFEAVPEPLEYAAMTLGRTRWSSFWSVTVPLAAPSLLAGAVLAWARALSEFGATFMFAGNMPGISRTLPLAVMTALETDLALAASLSLVSLLLGLASLTAARLLVKRWRR